MALGHVSHLKKGHYKIRFSSPTSELIREAVHVLCIHQHFVFLKINKHTKQKEK